MTWPAATSSRRTSGSDTRFSRRLGTTSRQLWEIATSRRRAHRRRRHLRHRRAGRSGDPELAGLERFRGRVFHSARWDHEHDLQRPPGRGDRHRRVGDPVRPRDPADRVDSLTLFQRTPPWVLPRENPPIPSALEDPRSPAPAAAGLARGRVFSLLESLHFGFRHPAVDARGRAAGPAPTSSARWPIRSCARS